MDVHEFAEAAVQTIAAHRDELDGLNVFPVPDADTGTNMYATLVAARDALASGDDYATGALLGARGNSGSILAAWLGPAVRGDLSAAADAAYGAVTEPVEGTMLTTARAAAGAAGDLGAAADAAAALELADSGALGLWLVLTAMAGRAIPPLPDIAVPVMPEFESGPEVEVMYVVDCADATGLGERLEAVGDSVVVATGDGFVTVHVHTDDPDESQAIGREFGVVREVRVESL